MRGCGRIGRATPYTCLRKGGIHILCSRYLEVDGDCLTTTYFRNDIDPFLGIKKEAVNEHHCLVR